VTEDEVATQREGRDSDDARAATQTDDDTFDEDM